ncbi:hypothetical protein DA717_13850, partial [Piscirickettsiaceae bacterium NZ-RLO2]
KPQKFHFRLGIKMGALQDKHNEKFFSYSKDKTALMFLESYFCAQNQKHPAQYPGARVTIEP